MRESMAMGEHARVTSHLPFRMIISDEELVLVMIEDPDHRMRMCVMRDPAMIALSLRLFERSWDQAIPVPIVGSTPRARRTDRGRRRAPRPPRRRTNG